MDTFAVVVKSVGGGPAKRLVRPWIWDTCYVHMGSIYGLVSCLNDWFLSSTPIVRTIYFFTFLFRFVDILRHGEYY